MIELLVLTSFLGLACAGNYSTRVDAYFIELQNDYPSSKSCVNTATNKMQQFSSKYDEDEQRAVALVNLYTQACYIGNGLFYGQLNANLRAENPTPFWKKTEDLLNEGMVTLTEATFADVYRGCANKAEFQPGAIYRFKQFISTSLKKSVASNFASSILFNIKGARGVDVSSYSQFPGEKEILLRSSSVFRVSNVSKEGNYRYVVLQYTNRLTRADEEVTEATYCDPESSSTATALPLVSPALLALSLTSAIFRHIA